MVRSKAWLLVGLLSLVSCSASAHPVPSVVFLEMFGGPASFSDTELKCLRRNTNLASILQSERSSNQQLGAALEISSADLLECFGQRTIGALIPENSPVGACQRTVYLRLLSESILKQKVTFVVALQDKTSMKAVVTECGPLEKYR
jgi:hypothetical protein